MSQQPKQQVENAPPPVQEGAEGAEGGVEGQEEPKEEMSPEQKQAYDQMMRTISKMNTKIEKVKQKLNNDSIINKKTKTDEMTNKLIESKQNSQIITKQNLLTDITQTYQKVVIGVYSQNSKLKKKIEQMASIIKEQSNKIYEHARKEQELSRENEELKAELMRMKDERMMAARGQVSPAQERQQHDATVSSNKKKNLNPQGASQNEDFDFWSMPQNDYGKKKKDFVQDSNLWVNQKEHDSPFITENNAQSGVKRKR